MRRFFGVIAGLTLVTTLIVGSNSPASGSVWGNQEAKNFKLIGSDPLNNRGMNAALAVSGNYAYVGYRSDGTHPDAGVAVVDVSKPSDPKTVQIMANTDPPGVTTREMRVWQQQHVLIVMDLGSNCTEIHACSPTGWVGGPTAVPDKFSFYDISGKNAADPKLISTYTPSESVHEFYLWQDPKRPGRALMYISTPGQQQELLVTDISGYKDGKFNELYKWSAFIPNPNTDNRLHSMSVNTAGTRIYIAYLGGGFLEGDVSDFAADKPKPTLKLITPMANRPNWGDPGVHSAVPFFGRPYVLTTDEVYGYIPGLLSKHGCPWGWVHIIDLHDEQHPKVIAQYKLPQNEQSYCDDHTQNTPIRNSMSSWSSHNPTLTPHLAFVTWHSGGFQAIDLTDPAKPTQAGEFRPEPLNYVETEDPLLSSGQDKVVMWSYPIIKDGLIYVVDIRNGLYILKYTGKYADEVSSIKFLEGNSNMGDAMRFEPVKGATVPPL